MDEITRTWNSYQKYVTRYESLPTRYNAMMAAGCAFRLYRLTGYSLGYRLDGERWQKLADA